MVKLPKDYPAFDICEYLVCCFVLVKSILTRLTDPAVYPWNLKEIYPEVSRQQGRNGSGVPLKLAPQYPVFDICGCFHMKLDIMVAALLTFLTCRPSGIPLELGNYLPCDAACFPPYHDGRSTQTGTVVEALR